MGNALSNLQKVLFHMNVTDTALTALELNYLIAWGAEIPTFPLKEYSLQGLDGE